MSENGDIRERLCPVATSASNFGTVISVGHHTLCIVLELIEVSAGCIVPKYLTLESRALLALQDNLL